MTKRLIVSLALAGSIRYLLMLSHYSKTIKDRVEVATPLNSWKRGELSHCSHSHPLNHL